MAREGSTSYGERDKFCSKPSIIARPPAWMQKCWNACLKSGTYAGIFFFGNILRAQRLMKNLICSDQGRTMGPMVERLVLRASPTTAIRSLPAARRTPFFVPELSSICPIVNTRREGGGGVYLPHGIVRSIIGGLRNADDAEEAVLRTVPISGSVGEDYACSSHSKQCILYQHGLKLA